MKNQSTKSNNYKDKNLKNINDDFLINNKKQLNNWKFWYKLAGATVIIIGLLINIIFIFIEWPNIPIETATTADLGDSLFNMFCYFTIQSNFFVLIWFLYVAFNPKKEGMQHSIGSPYATLSFTLYITITFLIYNLVLLPSGPPPTIHGWISTAFLHMIAPLMMIIYFCFFYEINQKSTFKVIKIKNFLAKKIYLMYIYPTIWVPFVTLRSFFRLNSKIPSKENSAFLYFFMDYRTEMFGIPWIRFILIMLVVFFVLGLGLAILYQFIMTLNFKKQLHKGTKND